MECSGHVAACIDTVNALQIIEIHEQKLSPAWGGADYYSAPDPSTSPFDRLRALLPFDKLRVFDRTSFL